MNAVPALQTAPTLDELESLFVNNPDLDEIRAHLSKFNPIKTMGMARMEIRHSAILAWLLTPQETHGLGDKFLKAFISEALRGHHAAMQPSALKVSQADMMDTEVRREWKHIDILLMSPANKWVFVIENKFDSGQHTNQLTRYLELVRLTFDQDDFSHIRGIFLSLWDEEPNDDRYAPINYGSICEILEQQVVSGRHPLTAEVETFVNHYLEVIREAADMSEEQKALEQLAKQLYRDHRRVLDFIIEHGKATDFSFACDTVFGEELEYGDIAEVERKGFVFNHSDASHISFLPQTWYEALGEDEFYWHGCENWWMGFPVIMWVQLTVDADGTSGKIRLFSEVGPISDHDFRRDLINAIQDTTEKNGRLRIGFQRGAADEGRRYSKMFKKNSFSLDDIHDQDKIANTIKKALKDFRPEIDAIAAVLPKFASHGKYEPNEE
ncbi:PDDEXK-like family protein [Acidimangrovimonas sediminis]|uniref:PDDEXK-like family protein n=1 Tax=Acidimangrovimonas sediminis TaxID=2056283 RepID=UPI000C7FC9F3|nr:PD-(D/E)XK nuclease family protein [Acidimangrovimonas sediminis]